MSRSATPFATGLRLLVFSTPGSFDPNGIHHGSRIIHSLIEIGQLPEAIGKTGAAFVEQDNSSPACQMIQPASCFWPVPIVLDVRNKSGNNDKIDRAISKDLIGDMDIAALCIMNLRYHGTASSTGPSSMRLVSDCTIADPARARDLKLLKAGRTSKGPMSEKGQSAKNST